MVAQKVQTLEFKGLFQPKVATQLYIIKAILTKLKKKKIRWSLSHKWNAHLIKIN